MRFNNLLKGVLGTAVTGLALLASGAHAQSLMNQPVENKLINGEVVDKDKYRDVVNIFTGNSGCSATVVGPKVVMTAAHCGNSGSTSKFTTAGKTYQGKFYRSSIYPAKDHDIAMIITDTEIKDVDFVSVGGIAEKGTELVIFGYGCTMPGGTGGNDGKLRMGKAKVSGFSGYDMVSGGGAALCFGDSGGPSFKIGEAGERLLLGINSKGNIRDTNYNTRTDTAESKKFFADMIAKHKIDICGVNMNCAGTITPPAPDQETQTTDYEFKDLQVGIPDNARNGISFDLPVTQDGTFMDLALEYKITHGFVADLQIELVSPEGKTVRVYNRARSKTPNLNEKVGMGGKPIDLKIFDGMVVEGTWKIVIKDLARKDLGVLNYVKLTVKSYVK